MARNPDDPRHWFAKLLDMARRKPPPKPEPSYFARVDIDREAERREAEAYKARQQREAALKAERAKPPPPPPRHPVVAAMERTHATKTGRDFDKAAQTSKHLTQQAFDARFRSETARATAFAAMEEASKLRDLNDQAYDEARQRQREMIRDLNGRPWSDEYGKAINEVLDKAWEAHEQEKRTIAYDLEMALAEAEGQNPKTHLKGFRKPLGLTGPEPISAKPFNHASGVHDWPTIFWHAAKAGVSIEAVQAELKPAEERAPEPVTEPSMGREGTPPDSHTEPKPEQGIDMDP